MLFNAEDPIKGAAESYAVLLQQDLDKYAGTDRSALPKIVDWQWIFAAESELLRRLPEPELRRRAWIIYDRYASIAGAERSARRAAANTLNIDNCDFESLRADLLQVQAETARLHTIGYEVEHERGLLTRMIRNIAIAALVSLVVVIMYPALAELARWIVGATAFIIVLLVYFAARPRASRPTGASAGPFGTSAASGVIVFLMFLSLSSAALSAQTITKTSQTDSSLQIVESKSPEMAVGAMVALAGILGATFSIMQRAQRNTIGLDPVVALFSLRAARRQAYLSLAGGAIGALLLYCVFAGGMVQGALFPAFVNKWTYGTEVRFPMKLFDFLESTGPQTHFDHGKLLVWCFIAGFAERFVPDMLDRFTTSGNK